MKPFTLSNGNSKLIDTLIFNLPAKITCPGATRQCAAMCYAVKAERMYTTARDSRQRNLDLVRDNPDWHTDFITQLDSKLQRSRKVFEYFRIHESGDFFNQAYVDSWVTIARHFPELKFLAYTKSHHLNFADLQSLPNVTLRYSVWEDTKKFRDDMPLAVMDGIVSDRPTHHCKPGDKCGPCRYCWASNKDVMFTLH
jgi:hypothetical protein